MVNPSSVKSAVFQIKNLCTIGRISAINTNVIGLILNACAFRAIDNMTTQQIERLKNWKLHDSMRGWFGRSLYTEMGNDPRVVLITADLGFGLFDAIRDDFPDRFLNTGASEQAMIGIAVGLAIQGKIPFCYSITPFLIYRPFEWIRNYLHHERIPVKLIGSGLDDDYKHDGFTHHCPEVRKVLSAVPNIKTYLPLEKESIPGMVEKMCLNDLPCFMALRR